MDFVVYERVNALVPLTGRYRTYLCKNSSCDGLKSFGFTTQCIPPFMGRCTLENGIYGLLKGSSIFEKVLVLIQNAYVCLIIGASFLNTLFKILLNWSCSWRGAHLRNVGFSIPPSQYRSIIMSAHLYSNNSRA